MDPELLRLLLEILRNQNTTGSAAIGGDVPYDDYGVFSDIGGLGAAPIGGADPLGDGAISALNTRPANYDTSPSTVGFYGPQAEIANKQRMAELLAQMQQGVGAGSAYPQMSGLFGGIPTIQRPHTAPPPTAPAVAAPEAGQLNAPPRGTPTPDPRRDPSTLPHQNDSVNVPRKARPAPEKRTNLMRAPQAAQHIVTQSRAAQPQRQYSAPTPQPQRQYSAPAPVFTPAPASRSAAQNTLAQTLNTMRSLNRR